MKILVNLVKLSLNENKGIYCLCTTKLGTGECNVWTRKRFGHRPFCFQSAEIFS